MLWTSRCNGGPIFKVVPEGVKNIQILKIADFTIFRNLAFNGSLQNNFVALLWSQFWCQ